jgi:two-component system, OmpR family, response regulator
MRVLVVQNDLTLAKLMRGHAVLADVATSAQDALWMAVARHYDVIALALTLPEMNGLELCRRLRGDGVATPILVLTARPAADSVVAALDSGADDCVTTAIHPAELLARLRALARRAPRLRTPPLRVGDLRLDRAACRVHRGEHEIHLTPRERRLLEVLMRHADQTVPRRWLVDDVWDGAVTHGSNIVEVYVRYVRNKIDRPFGLATLETVRGIGYRLNAPAERLAA